MDIARGFGSGPVLAGVALLIGVASRACAEATLLDGMDTLSFQPGNDKVMIELVDGHLAKALRFSFAADCRSTFANGRVHGEPSWDQAAGISFWVKGDGSAHLGGIELVWNEDFAQRYDCAFAISGTQWSKVTIPWSDLIPATSNPASGPLDAAGAHPPSKLGRLWFGKWWYWGDYAAHAYAIDDIRLEPVIAPAAADPKPAGAPLARTLAKLKAGKPITVVTMGDSLTDLHHWTNRDSSWPGFLKTMIADAYHSDTTIVNPAMGGTELRQNLVVMPRWLASTPHPDLVTVEFGGNDWASGMRGAAFLAAQQDAIRRIRRATGDQADVLIIATLPSVETWDVIAELAAACRNAAKSENAGLCDAFAVFHSLGKEKEGLYASDHVHLGQLGQRALAQAVLDAIAASGK